MTQLFSIYTLLVLITVSLVLSTSAEANDSLQDNDLLVKTKTNVLQGISTEDGSVNAWLGIPFAEPPINDLRWKSPIMKQSSDETLILSDQFSPSCYQSSQQSLGEFGPHNVTVSQDCLTLNIWSPSSKPPNTLLPVVVFIHGGAFINGDATFYPGTTLVKQSNIKLLKEGNITCLYEGDLLPDFCLEMFNADYWQARNSIIGSATGRGTTWFIKHDTTQRLVATNSQIND